MTSIRLTNDMRTRTLETVLAATFDKRFQKLREDANKLSARALKRALGPKLYQLLLDLPAGWVGSRTNVKVECAGTVIEFECNEYRVPVNKSCNGWGSGSVMDIIDRSDPLCDIIEKHIASLKELKSESNRRRVEINAVLESATTVAKLLDMWPEVEPYLPPAAITQIDRTVPVVQIQALNEALGLKMRKRAA